LKKLLFYLFLIFILTSSISLAATAEELLKAPGLDDRDRSAIANAIAKVQTGIPAVKDLEKWQAIGDAFAITIKNICRTLSVEVNEFLKTDVGILITSVIVYKMIGKDILRIIIYTFAWFGFTFIFACSIFFLHMKKKIKNKETKEITYRDRIEWSSTDVRTTSVILHIIIWFGFSAILLGSVI
jgi:hypothetical protein